MPVEPTIKCGKQYAEHADMSGSKFHDVNLARAEFDDVNMTKVRFHNINMSDIDVSAVQIGGARFKHVGLPPGSAGKQRPLSFEEADLNGTTISKCDLSNVKIENCRIEGMTVNGFLVTELITAYEQRELQKANGWS
jgi:uncharacterized protein YjbI with pentapeptide repeats